MTEYELGKLCERNPNCDCKCIKCPLFAMYIKSKEVNMDKIEQRIEQIEKFASQCYEDGEKYLAFIAGAIWADNNPVNVWHDASEMPKEGEWI